MTVLHPSGPQIEAAVVSARKAIYEYSAWYSSMVPDEALRAVVGAALVAALNVPGEVAKPIPAPQPQPAPGSSADAPPASDGTTSSDFPPQVG